MTCAIAFHFERCAHLAVHLQTSQESHDLRHSLAHGVELPWASSFGFCLQLAAHLTALGLLGARIAPLLSEPSSEPVQALAAFASPLALQLQHALPLLGPLSAVISQAVVALLEPLLPLPPYLAVAEAL